MFLRVGDQIHAAFEIPLAPGSDDFDVGLQRVIRQLKTHLIVAFAGRAVRDSVSAFLLRDFDLAFRNHRARERRAHQVNAFVDRVGFDGGPDVIAHKLFAQIFDVEFRSAGRVRLLFETRQLRTLAHVGAVADNFTLVVFLQPAQASLTCRGHRSKRELFFECSLFIIRVHPVQFALKTTPKSPSPQFAAPSRREPR